MGYFNLAVKGLYAGLIYFIAIFLLDGALPGELVSTAFSVPAIILVFLLMIFEFFIDYGKAPGAG